MRGIALINKLYSRLLINLTLLLYTITTTITTNNNKTALDNRIRLLAIILQFVTEVKQQFVLNIGLIIDIFGLYVLVSSLLVDKVVELVHFYVSAYGGVELGGCCD